MLLRMFLLLQFGSYVAIKSQQKLEIAPVHNLDADQSVGFINFKPEEQITASSTQVKCAAHYIIDNTVIMQDDTMDIPR